MPTPNFTDSLPYLTHGALLASATMLLAWLIQFTRRNATHVDVFWTLNLALLAILYARTSPELPSRRILIATLVTLWSLRLAAHLLLDRAINKPEDGRYRTLRTSWGKHANFNFFLFFQAQALLDVVLSLPFLLVCLNPSAELHLLEYAGVSLWLIAITGESIADHQLSQFKKHPESRTKICRRGLWHYSRHPNYFFEWLHWVAYALIALSAPYGWLALTAPAIMLLLLWRVTGIPATEAHAIQSRGQDYLDYQRTTSAFIPWFPKHR